MAAQESSSLGSISLDQLVALNDEIAALVRAKVPLEEGLTELGSDVPGRLGKLMSRLADDASHGKPLGEVLADPLVGLPPVYRAVVEAGLRAGRLPAALESIAGSVRRLAQMHRYIATALLYPALLVILAWGLFAGFTVFMAPRLTTMFTYFNLRGVGFCSALTSLGQWAVYWGPAGPLLVVLLGGIWVCRSRSAMSLDTSRAGTSLTWLPWFGSIMRWSRAAIFCDMLATLVENRVPLHEAIVLAGEASGDPATIQAAKPFAAALERGETVPIGPAGQSLPPLLRWLIQVTQGQGALLSALRHAADTYRSRAQYQANLAGVLLPVVLAVVIGGTVTLIYSLIVLGPYIAILRGLS